MKVLCVGDNCIDDYKNLKVMYPGGNSLNVAAHAAILNEESYYLGNIADDLMGRKIIDTMNEVGIDYSYCRIVPNSSTKYCDYDVVDGERTFLQVVVKDNWANAPKFDTLPDIFYEANVIHTGVNAKCPEEIAKWQNLKCPLVFDFGEKEKYRVDEYIKPFTGIIDLALLSVEENTDIKKLCAFLSGYGIRNILMTMGSDGQYFYNGQKLYHHPVKKVKAVDTMGAGDAFVTAFMISAVKDGWKKNEVITDEQIINRALEKGSEYSALNCLKEGAFGIKINY